MTRTRALFCDLLGLPKGKYIPSDLAKSGDIGFAACAINPRTVGILKASPKEAATYQQ